MDALVDSCSVNVNVRRSHEFRHMTHLFGNVIEHRKDNTFLVSLNDGTVVNAIIPKAIARMMFRVVSGDPVAIVLSESERRIKFQDSLLAVTLSAIGMKTQVAFVTDGVGLPISSSAS